MTIAPDPWYQSKEYKQAFTDWEAANPDKPYSRFPYSREYADARYTYRKRTQDEGPRR